MTGKIFRAAACAMTLLFLVLAAGCDGGTLTPPKSQGSGAPAGPFAKGEVSVPPADKTPDAAARTEVTLYFPTEDGERLVAVKAEIKAKDVYTGALRLLIGGTDEKGLTGVFPRDVRLLGLTVNDGVAVADFSEELIKNFAGGSTGERMLVSSIVNTLTEFSEIRSVLITVEGKRIETISGHLDTSEPFERPVGIVE